MNIDQQLLPYVFKNIHMEVKGFLSIITSWILVFMQWVLIKKNLPVKFYYFVKKIKDLDEMTKVEKASWQLWTKAGEHEF